MAKDQFYAGEAIINGNRKWVNKNNPSRAAWYYKRNYTWSEKVKFDWVIDTPININLKLVTQTEREANFLCKVLAAGKFDPEDAPLYIHNKNTYLAELARVSLEG